MEADYLYIYENNFNVCFRGGGYFILYIFSESNSKEEDSRKSSERSASFYAEMENISIPICYPGPCWESRQVLWNEGMQSFKPIDS